MDPARDARKLLRSRDFGVLATHSRDLPGYPFGSIAPYVLDDDGQPLLLIASIAQHTKNIGADPRVSLTIWEEGLSDPQAGARLTWIGDAARTADGDASAKARYLRYLPSSAGHFDAHDFSLYRILLKRGRFIGGFGSIHWIEPAAMRLANPLLPLEAGIVAHMNGDHAGALRDCCKAFRKLEASQAVMVGLDPEGFDVLADGRRVRFDFDPPVHTADEVRKAMVALARAAR